LEGFGGEVEECHCCKTVGMEVEVVIKMEGKRREA